MAKSAYKMLHAGSSPLLGHKLIWRTWAPLKVKILLWLAFRRRHWTADRRRRHVLDAREHCYLCDQEDESIDHIVATCSYSREVWFVMLQALGCHLPPASTDDTQNVATAAIRVQWRTMAVTGHPLCASVMERNARCFRNATASISEIMQIIKAEGDRWIEAGAEGLRALAHG